MQYFWKDCLVKPCLNTLFTPILFQLLSEHVLKQKFKPKNALGGFVPKPLASGGFVPKPPLAFGDWKLRPQTLAIAPPMTNS